MTAEFTRMWSSVKHWLDDRVRATSRRTTALLLVAVLCAGCGDDGPKLVKAGGKVTYNGQPLPNATVVFVPDANELTAFTTTDEQGGFTVATEGRPGAVVGSYKVAITAVRQKRKVSDSEAASMTNEQIAANHETLIPVKYNNVLSSGLTAKVAEDPASNNYVFELK